ncbi:type VII secretion protein EsaA [Metabacillus sp. HB246100]
MNQLVTILKLLLVIALIVVTPLVFFQTIGDNPFKVEKASAAQRIAIINEDMGTEEEGEQIQFGQDVAAILKENSAFEYTVVGRSAGENGLKNQKYDAVVYLPSNFSENVMTYNEENPVKTNFEYKVQSQLNSLNKEKVVLELEKATKKVNQKISTLYWNYISVDMETIRQEFDEILQKEIAFQEAMKAFYQPSSKDLTGQIEEQRMMLASLQSSIQNTSDRTPDQKSLLEGYEKSLASFVEFVEQYKEYQDNQQKVLADMQTEAILTVNQATQDQQPLFMQSKQLFDDEGNTFIENMKKLDTQMFNQMQTFGQLQEQRYSLVSKQLSEYETHQKKVLDFYQQLKDSTVLNNVEAKLAEYSESLSEAPEEPEEEAPKEEKEKKNPTKATLLAADTGQEGSPEESQQEEQPEETDIPSGDDTEEEQPENPEEEPSEPPTNPDTPEDTGFVDLEAERNELSAIIEEINKLKEILSTNTDQNSEEYLSALEGLGSVQDRIAVVAESLRDKESGGTNPLQEKLEELQQLLTTTSEKVADLELDKKNLEDLRDTLIEEKNDLIKEKNLLTEEKEALQELYDELFTQATKLEEELNLYKDYEANIKEEIERKEQSILASKALSETRKTRVNEFFSKEIKSKDLLDMMFYYSYLDRYEATLISMASIDQAKIDTLTNEALQQEANKIVEIKDDEDVVWTQLSEDLPSTRDALHTMEDQFTLFMVEYETSVNENQGILVKSLEGIQEDAQNILTQIQQPEIKLSQAPPTSSVEGQQMVSGSEQITEQMDSMHTWLESVQESQSGIIDYTNELQGRISDVQADADKLNSKWASNVASTELIRDDVFSVLGNTFVDGQSNGYVYDFLTNPLKVSGDIPEETKSTTVQNIPPVVVLFIVLVCSLLVGYTSYYFQQPPAWIQAVLFTLLNLIVGFVISLFGLEIYPLREESAVEWTVFTILLLTVGSALVRVALSVHLLAGAFITVGLVIFYVTPLLALTTPNFSFQDPMSKVYMSIQYGTESLFTQAIVVLGLLLVGLGALQYFIGRSKMQQVEKGQQAYEA